MAVGIPHCRAEELPTQPVRIVTLVSGERFVGEWLPGDATTLLFRQRDQRLLSLEPGWIQRIENPQGVMDLGQFSQVNVAVNRPWSHRFPTPMTAGVCEIWRPSPQNEEALPFSMTIQLHSAEEAVLSTNLQCDSTGLLTVVPAAPATVSYRQPLRWTSQAEPLVLTWVAGRWSVLLGEKLLARGVAPVLAYQNLTLSSDADLSLQRVLICATHQREGIRQRSDFRQDALYLQDGSVLLGFFAGEHEQGILWRASHRPAITIPWSEFQAIEFRRRDLETSLPSWGEPVTGTMIAWGRPGRTTPFPLPDEQWLGALSATGAYVHPLLGAMAVPPDLVATSQTHFRGTLQWLCPELVHLGDEREENWPVPLPLATSLSGVWNLEVSPTDEVWMAADFSELEPCGPATPPDQPYLQALQRGELLTTLWVNDQRVGAWNHELAWRPPVDRPQRLRLRIPGTLLKSGTNHWAIRQNPSPTTGHLDDLLLSRVALEVVTPPSP